MAAGLLLVVSGPSGAGKGTVCRELLRRLPGLWYSVSATTRPPRPGERPGVDYYFISEEEFRRLREADALLEWAQVYGDYYGTPRAPVVERLAQGQDVLLEIDVQGARQVKARLPEAVTVFLLPPSYGELARRLAGRGTEDAAQMRRRLELASFEIERAKEYDYLVVNEEIAQATAKIEAIITAEKCRPQRAAPYLLQEGIVDE
ncbi:MAG: guanylate kinase [Clostridia bacterium]|nr:guanylate kinase [Clostridia bacterium]